eukprot:TRINITY_DN78844_c0_g1_i1.p1 TRINITY_DN78844_c0_g1~~TRINITY_DN78844_c0_g1_i1.p1  ORF type:complete len:484 (+),score=122.00 TRINITY_DN78844_c0_g1_i1:313-1764(+)
MAMNSNPGKSASRMVEWCIRCGQNLSTKSHNCTSNGSAGYSIPGLTAPNRKANISAVDEAFAFSPPLAESSMRNSGILSVVAAGVETPTRSSLTQEYFNDRLEDTKLDHWSAPAASSFSSLAIFGNSTSKSPVETGQGLPATTTTANSAGGGSPDRNIWNVSVLSEYQLFKPSSSAPMSDALLSLAGVAGFSNTSSLPNDSSWTRDSNLTSSGNLNTSSGSLDGSSFPSKFSDCKDYVGTGIADLLSPASLAVPKPSSSAPNASKIQTWSSNSTDGEDEYDLSAGVTTRKLFVGRVPKDATEESVLSYFSQFGIVESADVNADRGCCFITFMDSATVDRILEGKNVKYLDLEGSEVCARRYVVIEKDKIFVRGLATGTSKDDLFKYFKQFGRIVNITLHQNKNGAHPFAFVRFARNKSVNQIMARNDHVICGKMIHCLRAHRQDGSANDEVVPVATSSNSQGQPAALSKHFNRMKVTNDEDSS